MPERVFIIGVGMSRFCKPGKADGDYPEFAKQAGERALQDACIEYGKVDQAVASYCYGDSTCGQRALYELGMSGVPIMNVNNNCSSGSSALYVAQNMVRGGVSSCAMALGFEKMKKGSLSSAFNDRTNPMDKHVTAMAEKFDFDFSAPPAAQIFGNAGRAAMEKYGTKPETFAKIAQKNHRNSTRNPYSQFTDEYSLEDIKNAPVVYEPLTKLQCCPTSDGAACVIVANEKFVKDHGLEGQAVEIVGMAMATDKQGAFDNMYDIAGFGMTRSAADQAYEMANVTADQVQVCELHDCFSCNEYVTYEALRFCPEGKAEEFVNNGDNDYGGKIVCNPSGGLISKGHPLGATGLAQATEITWQLRGEAVERQVKDAKIGCAHNIGLGGAAVVTILKRPEEWLNKQPKRKISLAAGPPELVPPQNASSKL